MTSWAVPVGWGSLIFTFGERISNESREPIPNDSPERDRSGDLTHLLSDGRLHAGFSLLWQAHTYAINAGADRWDFALEIDKLYESGMSISDIRWLVTQGLVEHGEETSQYGDLHRSFETGAGLTFVAATCLVCTVKGAEFCRPFGIDSSSPVQPHGLDGSPIHEANNLHWDPLRRELRWGDAVVKRFRMRAQNQELILQAFHEQGWPERIDDPLPCFGETNPKTRLHDAINRLNRKQENALIRFHGNGGGNGVCWSLRDPEAAG